MHLHTKTETYRFEDCSYFGTGVSIKSKKSTHAASFHHPVAGRIEFWCMSSLSFHRKRFMGAATGAGVGQISSDCLFWPMAELALREPTKLGSKCSQKQTQIDASETASKWSLDKTCAFFIRQKDTTLLRACLITLGFLATIRGHSEVTYLTIMTWERLHIEAIEYSNSPCAVIPGV